MRVRFTRSARKHRIGRGHALHVMNSSKPIISPATDDRAERRTWIGNDDRGLELEIVAIVLDEDELLVIHVMPTVLRRRP